MVSLCSNLAKQRGPRGWTSRVLLTLIAVSCCLGLHAQQDSDSILKDWFTAQDNLKNWKSDFTQTRSLAALTHPLVSTGRVWYASPGSLRWELGSPAQTIALRVRNEMLIAYPNLQRAEHYNLNQQTAGPMRDAMILMEAGFPRGQKALLENYTLSAESDTNGLCHITLKPHKTAGQRMVASVLLTFQTNSFLLTGTEIEFVDGSQLKNSFFDGQSNTPLPEDTFSTNFVEGYTITQPLKQ